MEVRGLLLSGLPRTVTIKGQRFVKVCRNPIGDYRCGQAHWNGRRRNWQQTSLTGALCAGGGALLKGLDTLISHETGIAAHVAAIL